ncbi:MAG: type II CAAX endopeptidase family protein [Candidatus Micrarchaeaceae archaeon]
MASSGRQRRKLPVKNKAAKKQIVRRRKFTAMRQDAAAANSKRPPNAAEPAYIKYPIYAITVLLFIFTFYTPVLFYYGVISEISANLYSTISLSLLFPFIVFSYMLLKGNNLKGIVDGLGLGRSALKAKYIGIGIGIFLIILLLEIATGIISSITGIPLPTNVGATLAGFPLFFYIFTFTIAPIDEEILFRGFLVPRIGIFFSSLIFAILHFGYGSIVEFIAAFIFGIIAGYAFKKTKSLYATIIAHALVNFLSILILFLI